MIKIKTINKLMVSFEYRNIIFIVQIKYILYKYSHFIKQKS